MVVRSCEGEVVCKWYGSVRVQSQSGPTTPILEQLFITVLKVGDQGRGIIPVVIKPKPWRECNTVLQMQAQMQERDGNYDPVSWKCWILNALRGVKNDP